MRMEDLTLKDIMEALIKGRKLIFKITCIFFLIGVIFALISPVRFHSYSKFISLNSAENSLGGDLGGLASLAGIGGNSLSGSAVLPPEIYPEIVNSYPFLIRLLDATVTLENCQESITYRDYYLNHYKMSGSEYIMKYTLGLPSILLGLLKGSEPEIESTLSDEKYEFVSTSFSDYSLLRRASSQISINVSQDGMVRLGFDIPESLMAAEMAQFTQNLLQEKLIEFKISKAKTNLEYTNELYLEKRDSFLIAEQELAVFNDRNLSLITETSKSELRRKQSKYDIALTLFNDLSSQLEKAKIKVKEDTPIFSIIEPVRVPIERVAPRRSFIAIVFTLIGFFVSAGLVVIRLLIRSINLK